MMAFQDLINIGNGFEKIAESLGYVTSEYSEEDLKYFGDSNAKKGGTLRDKGTRYPATLRTFGKESNYLENSIIEELVYEPLLELDPLTWEPTVPRFEGPDPGTAGRKGKRTCGGGAAHGTTRDQPFHMGVLSKCSLNAL